MNNNKVRRKGVIETSQEEKLKLLEKQYIFLVDTIDEYKLMLNGLENQIISLFESLGTNKQGRIRLTSRKTLKQYSIGDLKSLFNNHETSVLFNGLIVSLDIDKSIEALKYGDYNENIQEAILEAFEIKLRSLSQVETPVLVLERKEEQENE